MRTPRASAVGSGLALAATYVVLAKVGLQVATVGRSVTLVWPPTGLALAALMLGSRGLWPGVALGAFVTNASTPGVGLVTAALIATGNTLEAVVGATLVNRAGFRPQLDGLRDVLRFTVLGAVVATLVSATIGACALYAGGLIPSGALLATARVWWVGDALGALVFAPALLTWGSRAPDVERGSAGEAILLAAALVIAALGSLTQPHVTRPYLVFPPLIWAALRFGPRGATAATLVTSIVTVSSTITGHGAFAVSSLGENLMALDAFMATVALTAFVLGATSAERTRALRASEHFISIAAHELRTPLAPLRLQIQRVLRRLRRDPGSLTTEAIVDALDVADRQAARLAALLENVLDLSALERGSLPLRPAAVDAATVVDEVGATLRESVTRAGCSLTIEHHGPTIGTWDRARLGQVVMNLVANAVKHGGPGAIEISVAGTPERTTIVVRDHGPGVEPEQRERIFGRFQHRETPSENDRGAHEPSSSPGYTHGRGLGLGLYIAREIVEAHGGRLSVASPPGGGAAFTVELPTHLANDVAEAPVTRRDGSAARTS